MLKTPVLITIFLIVFSIPVAFGHTTVEVEQYQIEVGWDIEPPVVGYRNAIVYEISESPSEGVKSGVISAFKNLQSTVKSGGAFKILDIDSDPRPGHYFSKIIPTKTGSMIIELKGDINGVPIDLEILIEDVESTAVLDFPSQGAGGSSDITPLKNALSSLQKDVSEIKSKVGGVDVVVDDGQAYDFAIFALSLGAAGVILAIIAMIKRK